MNERITTDAVAQQFAVAIRLLLEWINQEFLVGKSGRSVNGELFVNHASFPFKERIEATRLMNVDEVAATLHISKQQVYSLVQRDEIPSVRIGRPVSLIDFTGIRNRRFLPKSTSSKV